MEKIWDLVLVTSFILFILIIVFIVTKDGLFREEPGVPDSRLIKSIKKVFKFSRGEIIFLIFLFLVICILDFSNNSFEFTNNPIDILLYIVGILFIIGACIFVYNTFKKQKEVESIKPEEPKTEDAVKTKDKKKDTKEPKKKNWFQKIFSSWITWSIIGIVYIWMLYANVYNIANKTLVFFGQPPSRTYVYKAGESITFIAPKNTNINYTGEKIGANPSWRITVYNVNRPEIAIIIEDGVVINQTGIIPAGKLKIEMLTDVSLSTDY